MGLWDVAAGFSGRAGEARIVGLDGLLKSLNRAERDVNIEIRKRARGLAQELAKDIKENAGKVSPGSTAQASLAAISVQGRSDRVVYISGGGTRKLRTTKTVTLKSGKTKRYSRGNHPLLAYQIFPGTEFGSKMPRFPNHPPTRSYYFYKTIEEKQPEILKRYLEAINDALRNWGSIK